MQYVSVILSNLRKSVLRALHNFIWYVYDIHEVIIDHGSFLLN